MNNNYNFNDLLKNKGLKVTKHRISILEILYKNEEPISAEEIYDKLKTSNISISLSSIYKILDTFTTNKLINKCIIKNDSKTYFEINNSTHKHHLICKKCNKVLPIENCPLCYCALHKNVIIFTYKFCEKQYNKRNFMKKRRFMGN